MKQADLGLNLTTKRTRTREVLGEMGCVMPWATQVGVNTILRFRHLLETRKMTLQIQDVVKELLRNKGLQLNAGAVADATLISVSGATENTSGDRDPQALQSKKGSRQSGGWRRQIGPRVIRESCKSNRPFIRSALNRLIRPSLWISIPVQQPVPNCRIGRRSV